MTDLHLSFDILTGQFAEDVLAFKGTIADGATAAMDEVAGIVKVEARADIARAGFSKRWQNALRVVRYPRKGVKSIDASVFLFHKIQYAGIFDDGAVIKGQPLLWLPLSTTPQKLSGRATRPGAIRAILGGTSKLVSMGARGGTPLLGATIRLSRTAAGKATPKVTQAALKRGNAEGAGVLRTVPLFFGIREAKIPKQLSIAEICARARERLPTLYARHISEVLA